MGLLNSIAQVECSNNHCYYAVIKAEVMFIRLFNVNSMSDMSIFFNVVYHNNVVLLPMHNAG
jgi:hypothetical protein